MARDASKQLKEFLQPLERDVRARLVSELERSMLRGDAVAGCQLVLGELRRITRRTGEPMPRVGNPPRLFFRTFEPFLVNDPALCDQGNYIARASLMPLWKWICEKLMPSQAQTFCAQASAALLAGRADKAARLTRTFQDHALKRMQETLAAALADENVGRRIGFEIGTPRGLADLQGMIEILKARDALEALRLLAEIESVVDKINADPNDPEVGRLLGHIPNAARGLPARLVVPTESRWGRQLVSIRGELSDRLKREVERLPERVRHLLGAQPANDITLSPGVDQTAVRKTELLIELARVCAACAPQLHLQQTIWNAFSELRSDLKAAKQALLDELRIAAGDDREFHRSKVAAAVKICAKVFSDDYAADLASAAGVSVAPNRRPRNGRGVSTTGRAP
jgi:hypothetical protein